MGNLYYQSIQAYVATRQAQIASQGPEGNISTKIFENTNNKFFLSRDKVIPIKTTYNIELMITLINSKFTINPYKPHNPEIIFSIATLLCLHNSPHPKCETIDFLCAPPLLLTSQPPHSLHS